jgi:hypothetical protein
LDQILSLIPTILLEFETGIKVGEWICYIFYSNFSWTPEYKNEFTEINIFQSLICMIETLWQRG